MNNNTQKLMGHLMALFTSFVWGVTFVSSKIVLEHFTPLALMTIRFTLAYVALWIIHPKVLKFRGLKEEAIFAAAGLTGVFGYFLMENTAILYTTVSNVGLILAAVPLFVAIVLHLFTDDEHFHINLLYGFIIAITGVGLIIYNGQVNLEVNPFGDFLAIMAALVWALYSLALKKINNQLSPIIITRRIFFYGASAGVVMLMLVEGGTNLKPLFTTNAWMHVGFLGLVGSATCYVFWNKAINLIGAVKTSNYIYLMPLFTMVASVVVLNEVITRLMIVGCILILIGVYVAENGFTIKGKAVPDKQKS